MRCSSAIEWFWVVATPLGSGFDEASHVIKAAAVVRGEWLGQPLPHMSRAYMWMIVPGTFSQLTYRSDCYKLSPMSPASCEKAIVESSAPVRALTHVGRYPPLYYLFVGVPSLFGHSKNALYMMRFFSAMVSAALLALAVTLAFGYAGGRLLLAGVTVSLSPALFYLGSIVEPSSLEVSSAVCLWTALLLLVRRRPGPIPRPLVAAATLSAAALDLTRGLSPMWLAAILFVTLVVLAPPTRLREMWHDSAVRAGAVVVAIATGLAIAWTVGTDSLAFVRNLPNPFVHDSYPVIMRAIFGRTWSYVVEMLGGFNPRNTHASLGLLIVVGGCLVTLVLVGLVRGSGQRAAGNGAARRGHRACTGLAGFAARQDRGHHLAGTLRAAAHGRPATHRRPGRRSAAPGSVDQPQFPPAGAGHRDRDAVGSAGGAVRAAPALRRRRRRPA